MNCPMAWQEGITAGATSVPMSVLLTRVKAELDTLTQIVGDMQAGLSPLLVDASLDDPGKCRHAQSLDLIWQTLESLSCVMNAAANQNASQQSVNMAAIVCDLPLADLAARLTGLETPLQIFSNDLDLF